MAKKTKKQSKKLPENMLPQNIMPIGERVEADKNIYISQAAYKEIHKFTKNKTTNESGGMLIGNVIEEFGKTNILVHGFVEAKFCEASPTTLTFTHETWEYVHKEVDKKHKGMKIVGWIHTHPDFGIFLSEYDKFIHQNFFSEDYQIAYVVDPIQHIDGFYFWINGNIEKCVGFYIFDRTGVNITLDLSKENPVHEKRSGSLFQNLLIAFLAIVAIFLIFFNIYTNNQLETLSRRIETMSEQQTLLENQQYLLVEGFNQNFESLWMRITQQQAEIDELRAILTDAGIITPEVTEDPATEPSTEETTDTTDAATSTEETAADFTEGSTENG